uniref:Uncharacterized protein n=1 Tax=Aplanochytrium stocchinoi TaxID=215587 RepID=A0A7S3PE77_9STRA
MNGLPFPKTLDESAVREVKIGPELTGIVQSMAHSNGIVAAVDEFGKGFCKRYVHSQSQEHTDQPSQSKRLKTDTAYYNVEPIWNGQKRSNWDQGWTGICLPSETNCSRLATTSFFGKETLIMDIESDTNAIDKITHFLNPTCSKFLSKGPFGPGNRTVAVAEWNTVSIWDLRCSNKAVTQFRYFENFSDKIIYSLDACGDSSTIVFGGEGKDVSFADTRKWSVKNKWKCPVKYDVIGLHLSSDGSHCFAAGLDNELILHNLNAEVTKVARSKRDTVVPQSLPSGSLLHQNHRVFRSEAQWAGVSLWKEKGNKEDKLLSVVGYSISGKLYVLRYKPTKTGT